MLTAPKVLPKTRPANKTTNVCPVIGTGDIGITIRICALKAVTIAKPSETRKVVVDSFKDLVNKGELGDKHGNIPL